MSEPLLLGKVIQGLMIEIFLCNVVIKNYCCLPFETKMLAWKYSFLLKIKNKNDVQLTKFK